MFLLESFYWWSWIGYYFPKIYDLLIEFWYARTGCFFKRLFSLANKYVNWLFFFLRFCQFDPLVSQLGQRETFLVRSPGVMNGRNDSNHNPITTWNSLFIFICIVTIVLSRFSCLCFSVLVCSAPGFEFFRGWHRHAFLLSSLVGPFFFFFYC